MPSIRDKALSKFDRARAKIGTVGLRRYAVTIRRRVWSGAYVGDGVPTNHDIQILPPPKVRDMFSGSSAGGQAMLEYILQNGAIIQDRAFRIDKITPAYADSKGVRGGYTPAQIDLSPGPDSKSVEGVVVLVGDDGYARECVQMSLETDRSFGYSMIVKQTDRPHVAVASLAITATDTMQLVVSATFEDGTVCIVTPIVQWRTDAPSVAAVDVTGLVMVRGSGTANLYASFGDIVSPALVYVVP